MIPKSQGVPMVVFLPFSLPVPVIQRIFLGKDELSGWQQALHLEFSIFYFNFVTNLSVFCTMCRKDMQTNNKDN